MYITDLHIHSRFSRATSRDLLEIMLEVCPDGELIPATSGRLISPSLGKLAAST